MAVCTQSGVRFAGISALDRKMSEKQLIECQEQWRRTRKMLYLIPHAHYTLGEMLLWAPAVRKKPVVCVINLKLL